MDKCSNKIQRDKQFELPSPAVGPSENLPSRLHMIRDLEQAKWKQRDSELRSKQRQALKHFKNRLHCKESALSKTLAKRTEARFHKLPSEGKTRRQRCPPLDKQTMRWLGASLIETPYVDGFATASSTFYCPAARDGQGTKSGIDATSLLQASSANQIEFLEEKLRQLWTAERSSVYCPQKRCKESRESKQHTADLQTIYTAVESSRQGTSTSAACWIALPPRNPPTAKPPTTEVIPPGEGPSHLATATWRFLSSHSIHHSSTTCNFHPSFQRRFPFRCSFEVESSC